MPWFKFPKSITKAEASDRAAAAAARLMARRGRPSALEPVAALAGLKIATTFWGKAWCQNLESYSDLANRLPRGRSYVRHGAVIDLKIAGGTVRAQVAGSRVYHVEIDIEPLDPARWEAVVAASAGQIDSLVALLEGRFPEVLLRLVTDRARGLFPEPAQIAMTCSCPDSAGMCKHLAAVLYGVGARLDQRPELLFVLRGVDAGDLVHAAGVRAGATPAADGIAEDELGALFGIEMAPDPEAAAIGSEPEATKSAVTKPAVTKSRAAKPGLTKPKVMRGRAAKPGTTNERRGAEGAKDAIAAAGQKRSPGGPRVKSRGSQAKGGSPARTPKDTQPRPAGAREAPRRKTRRPRES